jgi:hypothetical protein
VVVLRDATAFEAASLTISSAQRITTVTVKYRYSGVSSNPPSR